MKKKPKNKRDRRAVPIRVTIEVIEDATLDGVSGAGECSDGICRASDQSGGGSGSGSGSSV